MDMAEESMLYDDGYFWNILNEFVTFFEKNCQTRKILYSGYFLMVLCLKNVENSMFLTKSIKQSLQPLSAHIIK